ncbi:MULTISPECIES: hypothetical protein [Isoptericola]|uniref:Uncharacterized protein n=1 Tax=Isoptericola sediminis TaxID=2733572 RepID=A0A849JUW4_9MICO|nr:MULTISPECIES: hypothetical protein [Isoptericola]MDO8144726.1 hypothetical protein [Isoptericola sp. 178]MDO8149504.1 hypothetical protein [Isoptericola sp. b515]MDO8152438.1 hypothetical protein [Isoptericola sp. b408]NNU26394.1 hypothetical protein [Isoptericola sediminis]
MSDDATAVGDQPTDRTTSLAPLDGLDDLPTTEHPARFEAVHEHLRARLDDPEGSRTDGAEA